MKQKNRRGHKKQRKWFESSLENARGAKVRDDRLEYKDREVGGGKVESG